MSEFTKKNLRDDAVIAALQLAGRFGWENISLEEISVLLKVSLKDLHEEFLDCDELILAYSSIVDKRVLKSFSKPELDVPPRDRLFDILMERYDILNEEKQGVIAVFNYLCTDPKQKILIAPYFFKSMKRMLNSAGISTLGCKGSFKIIGLFAIYLRVFQVWKNDQTEDMSQTMAAMDRALGHADSFAVRFLV